MNEQNEAETQKLKDLAERNHFAKLIGLEITEIKEGYAKGRIHLEKEHMNVYASMHGGCSYTMADTIAGIAASTYGSYVTTINGSFNYLKPVANTEYVYCEAKVVRQGGSIGVYDTTIQDDGGNILCTGTFNYYKLPKKIE